MAGKTILVAAIILAGCRGSVRESETVTALRRGEATTALRQDQSPLKIDFARAPDGRCAVRRLALHHGGLRGVSFRAMDRIPIFGNPAKPMTSAWRIQAESDQGSGTIVRVEGTKVRGDYYVGDGIFAGCNQSRLASAYFTLAPTPGVAEFEILQLG